MKKILCGVLLLYKAFIYSHCQMPCGIYHDQMVYDKVDEYYETMFKAVSALEDNQFSSDENYNQFIRWVMTKEKQSDDTAHLLVEYFLQQKIKPSKDQETLDQVQVIHNLLFMLVQIKQTIDLNIVKRFGKEWEHFKYLFHPEVKCEHPTVKQPGWSPEDEENTEKEDNKPIKKENEKSKNILKKDNKPNKEVKK